LSRKIIDTTKRLNLFYRAFVLFCITQFLKSCRLGIIIHSTLNGITTSYVRCPAGHVTRCVLELEYIKSLNNNKVIKQTFTMLSGFTHFNSFFVVAHGIVRPHVVGNRVPEPCPIIIALLYGICWIKHKTKQMIRNENYAASICYFYDI